MSKSILIIVTSNAKMGATNRVTGIWAEELAVPYYALVDAGYTVDIASPKGGAAPLDPASLKKQGDNSQAVERMLADVAVMAKVTATHPTSTITAKNYDGVFLPGGHGTMWDMADDKGVKSLVEFFHQAKLPIAAVCHGVSGLVSAVDRAGKPIVADRKINSFTNAEEEAAGLTSVMPFLLETRLRDLGAKFESAANWQAFAVRDGHIITGQNPQSSHLAAEHFLAALSDVKTKVA
jgi:putative intracellular protease/amidase